jgi:hypothetical protein
VSIATFAWAGIHQRGSYGSFTVPAQTIHAGARSPDPCCAGIPASIPVIWPAFPESKVSHIVGRNRFLTRLASGALVVAVAAGGGLLIEGTGNAVVPPGSLGTLTIQTPTSGTDIVAPVVRTSAGCSDPNSTSYELRIAGPIDKPLAQQVFSSQDPGGDPDYPIATNSSAGFSKTDPFPISFGLTFKDAAAARAKTLIAGEYSLTANCLDDFSNIGGTFTTSVTFDSPTAWHANGGTPSPSGTPAPTGTPSPSGTPSASVTATTTNTTAPSMTTTDTTSDSGTTPPPPSTSDIAGMSASADPGGGTNAAATSGTPLANTGAPIGIIFLVGLILLSAGLALVVWQQRPKKAK